MIRKNVKRRSVLAHNLASSLYRKRIVESKKSKQASKRITKSEIRNSLS